MVSVPEEVLAPAAPAPLRVDCFEAPDGMPQFPPFDDDILAGNPELAKPPVPQSLQKTSSKED